MNFDALIDIFVLEGSSIYKYINSEVAPIPPNFVSFGMCWTFLSLTYSSVKWG